LILWNYSNHDLIIELIYFARIWYYGKVNVAESKRSGFFYI